MMGLMHFVKKRGVSFYLALDSCFQMASQGKGKKSVTGTEIAFYAISTQIVFRSMKNVAICKLIFSPVQNRTENIVGFWK